MKTLILNSENVVAGSNNSKFIYNFPQGGYTFTAGDVIAIQEIAMYFSAFYSGRCDCYSRNSDVF